MSVPPLSAIGDQVDPVSSWTPERDDPDGVFTYVDLSAVDQNAKVVSGARELACSDAPSRARQLIRAGDVLVSTVRPNLNGVALVPPELDGATASTGFCVLRPRAGQLDARYLYQWVKSPLFVSDMVRKATGASYPAVSDRIVCESKLPLPPLPEQRRVAEILDKADGLRAKRRAAVAQLDTLTQSIFLDMFGDPATNPKGWPARTFEDAMQDETSRSKKLPQSGFLASGRYPVVDQGQSDIAGYCDDDRLLCQSNLPVVVFGDHTRTVKLVRRPFVVGADGAKVLVPQTGVMAEFLSWLLRLSEIPKLGYSRHMRELKRLSFPTPPMAKQGEFAMALNCIAKHRVLLETADRECESLFLALQHRAFRGEL